MCSSTALPPHAAPAAGRPAPAPGSISQVLTPPRTDARLAAAAGAWLAARFPRPTALLLIWAALAMTFTFTLNGDLDVDKSTDWVAAVKLLIRAGAGVTAGWLIAVAPRERLRALWPWLAPGALFVAYAVASAAWSPLRRITLFQAGTLGVLYALAAATALHAAEADLSRVLKVFCGVLLMLVCGLLAARVLAPNLGSMERRGVSLLHATNAAATASLGLILTAAARLGWGWTWARRLWPVAVPVHAVALLVAANRMSVALSAAALTALLAVCLPRRTRAYAALAVAVAGGVYLALDPGLEAVKAAGGSAGSFLQRGQTGGQLKKLSGREEMWTKMWASYRQAPLTGHGYFVTSETGEMYVWYKWGNWTAHNLLLQVLVTCGAAGTCLFLAAFGAVPAAAAWRLLRAGPYRGYAALMLLLGGWVFGWGLTNESFLGPLQPESVLYFVLYGLTVGTAVGQGRGWLRPNGPAAARATPAIPAAGAAG